MSHLVNTMAYAGETPWHGLGNRLSPNQSIDVWTEQAGMDWSIDSSPVRFVNGVHGENAPSGVFSEKRVLYRSDTLAPLSVVSERYKVVQPREVMEFYRSLTDSYGFELETAGVLKGGRKLWALAKTGLSTTLKGKDETRGYVLLATACDGTMPTTAQFTSIRVVCNNTLAVALSGTEHAVKIPHSTHFNASDVKHRLGISSTSWDEFMYGLKQLSERKVSDKLAHQFFQEVLNPNIDNHGSNRNIVRATELFQGKGRGATLASAEGTAFGLINAVTELVDHEKRARNADYRLDSAWFGAGAKIKHQALAQAMALVA